MSQTYEIRKKMSENGWGFLGPYLVLVDGEEIGVIQPLYKSLNSYRAYGYHTEVWLEHDALADETGFPNEYRLLKDAKAAVVDMMERNGINPREEG